uniref:Uncharacterized protein n=1 Tax=Trypanosoma vivax (strain Y486) TaxID=1055687 RepID=G0U9V1_TRYVY|nr:hypothetical protein TVY486_1100670 [Trypanosoma vivax Y486]
MPSGNWVFFVYSHATVPPTLTSYRYAMHASHYYEGFLPALSLPSLFFGARVSALRVACCYYSLKPNRTFCFSKILLFSNEVGATQSEFLSLFPKKEICGGFSVLTDVLAV